MKTPIYLNFQLIKFIWVFLLITGISGVASAATFIVTKTADTNDSVCDADCSLREAIGEANNSAANDVIIFSSLFNSPQTITLNGTELPIMANGTLTINGPGANLLTVSGNNLSRVFSIFGLNGMATINDLKIANGNSSSSGGAIYNGAMLTLNNSIVSNSVASFGGGGIYNDRRKLVISNSVISGNTNGINNNEGVLEINDSTITNNSGGIYNSRGTLTLTRSIVSNNTAASGAGVSNIEGNATLTDSIISNNSVSGFNSTGGGIINFQDGSSNPATMTIINSRITGNTAANGGGGVMNIQGSLSITNSTVDNNRTLNGQGGGLYIFNGTFNLNRATVNNNISAGAGGGISNGDAISTITNSTISNNTASDGGGIYSSSSNGPLTVVYSTISSNTATSRGGGIARGGGDTVVIKNSIIGDNTANAPTNPAPDFSGILTSQGYNLIENTSGVTINGTMTGNILGRDPLLAPLRNNGGATQTVALQATSPAVDAADPSNFPSTDQRGVVRPQDGDLNGTALPDIGAYERQVNVFTTTKITDSNDGICDADCSLREAIAAINAATTPDNVIVFNPALFNMPQTVNLTDGQLSINNTNGTVFISGPGANLLSISGNNQSRVFYVSTGVNVVISGVTITGGNGIGAVSSGVGGGIYNNGGRLTVTGSVVSANRTTDGNGGGIRNDNSGILTIVKSTIRNNTSDRDGGGVFNFGDGSIVNVSEATINNNSASSGGGIYNFSTLNITNSTVSGNSVILFGGGIFNDGLFGATSNLNSSTISSNRAGTGGGGGNASGTVNARNNIIADNTATNSAPDFSGALISPAYNLIENTNGTIITGFTTGNILGQDPRLLPLGNYGGVTQTQALRPDSPAIDKSGNLFVTTDQRGQPRPYDFPNIPNAAGGNGADIGAFERQPSDITGSTLFDFDGDGKADISVFRPGNAAWYLQQSASGFTGVQFGVSTDKIVPADYDGDGKTDVAVFRAGTWYLQRSGLGFTGVAFGTADDIPVPADYDGDGRADIAVFRPSNGTWYLLQSTAGFTGVAFGLTGDKPVAADYDGDGKADIAVFRNGTWYIQRSQLGFTGVAFGESTDKPVPADYDGDGKDDVAVFRPSNGTWYLLQSTAGFTGLQFGFGTDLPVPADYDGDGKTDVAVFRDGTWYLQRSQAGFIGVAFGTNTDKPVPNAFVP